MPPLDPSVADDGTFDLGDFSPPPPPVKDWKASLDRIEYDPTVVEITKVGISGVVGRELGKEGWKTLHSAPDAAGAPETVVEYSDSAARDAVKSGLLDIAEILTIDAGYAASFKDRIYGALIHHVRSKFLNGSSLGLADRKEVNFAWKMLSQVKTKVAGVPGLVAGIIEHGD